MKIGLKNPKSEIRNPKEIRRPKAEIRRRRASERRERCRRRKHRTSNAEHRMSRVLGLGSRVLSLGLTDGAECEDGGWRSPSARCLPPNMSKIDAGHDAGHKDRSWKIAFWKGPVALHSQSSILHPRRACGNTGAWLESGRTWRECQYVYCTFFDSGGKRSAELGELTGWFYARCFCLSASTQGCIMPLVTRNYEARQTDAQLAITYETHRGQKLRKTG